MTTDIILASKSKVRALLLKNAGLSFVSVDAAIDEEQLKLSYIDAGIHRATLQMFWQI